MSFTGGNTSFVNKVSIENYYDWCRAEPTAFAIWSAVSGICFLFGFPASLLVLHELLQREKQRVSSDVFMITMTLIDVFFAFNLPLIVANFMLWHNVLFQIIANLVYILTQSGRPFFMACICAECYIAVIHPIIYKTNQKLIIVKKGISLMIVLIMIGYGLAAALESWIVSSPFVSTPFIVALSGMTFCDISILRALREPALKGNSSIHPQKKRALQTIFNSLIMTFIVYLPPIIIWILGNLMSMTHADLFCGLSPYAYCFSTAGCVIMPVLHLINVGKLKTFKDWWRK